MKTNREIQNVLETFVLSWLNGDCSRLGDVLTDDAHGEISILKDKNGCVDGVYEFECFVQTTPKFTSVQYQLGNTITRRSKDSAYSISEIAVKAYQNEDYFNCIAAVAAKFEKNDDWKIKEVRMDVQAFDSPLRKHMEQIWFFDEEIAILKPGVRMQSIFPEMDNPFYMIENDETVRSVPEEIEYCFNKYNFGKDFLMYVYVKDALSDHFENDDKKHFIAYNKFVTQRYRYNFSSYVMEHVEVSDDHATAQFKALVPSEQSKTVKFVLEDGTWHILNIEGGK